MVVAQNQLFETALRVLHAHIFREPVDPGDVQLLYELSGISVVTDSDDLARMIIEKELTERKNSRSLEE